MPALHALQDHVVAMLQRQMQMRHEAWLIGDEIHQVGIGLDAVDRGKPEPTDIGDLLQQRLRQKPERQGARQIAAIAGGIDAGQYDLAITAVDEIAGLIDDGSHRYGAELPRP